MSLPPSPVPDSIRTMNTPDPTPPPLDLAQFQGHTPGPWATFRQGLVWFISQEVDEDFRFSLAVVHEANYHACGIPAVRKEAEANAALIAAAPALLAECQRQRHLLDAFAASVQDMLDAWDNPTSASVSMRCSAIAGLRGIMEHWPAGATDPEVTRLNAELTRLRAECQRLRTALEWIARGEGRYSTDRLTHANNTIEDMQAAARAALAGQED